MYSMGFRAWYPSVNPNANLHYYSNKAIVDWLQSCVFVVWIDHSLLILWLIDTWCWLPYTRHVCFFLLSTYKQVDPGPMCKCMRVRVFVCVCVWYLDHVLSFAWLSREYFLIFYLEHPLFCILNLTQTSLNVTTEHLADYAFMLIYHWKNGK